jgi:hypothetical protein
MSTSSPYIFDKCLVCGGGFRGIEGKVAVVGHFDTHTRMAYICPECAQTRMEAVT